VEGDRVVDAYPTTDPTNNQVVVSLRMDGKGARTWAQMTTEAAQDNNREVAIALDDEIVSAPSVNGPITGGSTQITGGFTLQEATDLANILKVGKLPAKTTIISSQTVGPSLGADNIQKSIFSLVVGISLLLLFMIFYYGKAGIVSIISLVLNLFFIFGALASLGTVLTVPGIAGIILTIGMAVDANVIIFERIREELRIGKTMSMAIRDGFKHSYSAIIDANVTTLLVAFVLAYFGIGPVKGFAVVLIIGVLSSLFTAVLLGRMIIEGWIAKEGRTISFWTPPTRNSFADMKIDWLSKRRIAYVVSGILILAGLASMLTRGFDYGVDFNGGYSYNIEFEAGQNVDAQDLRDALTGPFENEPTVKSVNAINTFNVTTDYLIDENDDDTADKVLAQLYEGINSIVGGNLDLEQFKSTDGLGTHVTSSTSVGPTIADDITKSSVYATIFALLLIFLYIFIRFNKYQYSLGAVAALFHDTLIVLGLFSILKDIMPFTLEIDQPFIAALLTVIGYSINDTVVVFDRIREYINSYTQKDKHEIINAAVNSTVSRTIITSLTTLFVVIILLVFGGSTIKGFAFALLIGILVGTYSSIFIATPVMVDLTKDLGIKKKSTGKRFSKAAGIK
jgi:SecD/SecF fusion protein